MKRKEAWPELLNNYARSVITEPMVWGGFDCCMFAANAVQEMTGEDCAQEFRGTYNSAAGAYAAIQRYAGGGIGALMEKMAALHGWTEVEPIRAQRGDIVMLAPECVECDERFDGALGMCVGTISLFVGEAGLKAVSTIPDVGTRTVIRAWRIPVGRD